MWSPSVIFVLGHHQFTFWTKQNITMKVKIHTAYIEILNMEGLIQLQNTILLQLVALHTTSASGSLSWLLGQSFGLA